MNPPSPTPNKPQGLLSTIAGLGHVFTWCGLIGGTLLLAIAWLWPIDLDVPDHPSLPIAYAAFLLRTFSFHITLGLAMTAIAAAILRQRRLALVGFALSLTTLGPVAWSYRPRDVPACDPADHLTILSSNLLFSNADLNALRREIDRVHPDIILFQEFTGDAEADLRAMLPDYPHVDLQPRRGAWGQAIFSRRPFAEPVLAAPGGWTWPQPQMYAIVEVAGRRLGILNIHTHSPAGQDRFASLCLQSGELSTRISQLLASGDIDGLVLAGDFNSTPSSEIMRRIRAGGVRDAHDEAGRGRGCTWLNVTPLKHLPGIRLDQFLISDAVVCTHIDVCARVNSDHRPIAATVGWRMK